MTQAPRSVADTAAPTDSNASRRPYAPLVWAVAALVVAVVLSLTFPAWQHSVPYGVEVAASYALTWVPLIAALIATALFWRRYLGFRPVDIYLGLMVGVVGRAVGILVQFFATGTMPSSGIVIGGITGVYVFTSVIAPVILAPLIEEPFFRGLLQGSLGRIVRPWPALIITSVIFTIVHTMSDGWSLTLVVEMLVYSLLAGYVVQQTKRLAPAVIGHAVFNGLAALISWPW